MAYPEPNSGRPKPTQGPYPEPKGGPINFGLDATTHKGSNYPQPNSAGLPGTDAPPGVQPAQTQPVPIAGAPVGPASTGNPGVRDTGNAGTGASK